MIVKTIFRNIPENREDNNDRFRVKYNDKRDFDILKVVITRKSDGSSKSFLFESNNLPELDSIHFTCSVSEDSLNIRWDFAVPFVLQNPTIIRLEPDWFKSGYYVYVVCIVYNSSQYFYIGMTGDRNHSIARSPFYRMAGHFSMVTSSTQNQLIKALRNNLNIQDIKTILPKMRFTYFAYPIETFTANGIDHQGKRRKTEKVESALISLMRNAFGKEAIFNKSLSCRDYTAGYFIGMQIIEDLKKRLIEEKL